MNNLQRSACLLLFALSTPAIAQEAPTNKRQYEMGILPFRYHIDNKFLFKNRYWQPVAAVYLSSYRPGSNFSWVAQLEYAGRNTDDACEGCTDLGDSEFNYRSLNVTLAARQTWGQRNNRRWQAFVQPGVFLGGNNFSGYRLGGWGTSEYYSYRAFAYGLDLGLGLKFMVTPKIPFTLTSKLLIGWESRDNKLDNKAAIVSNASATPLQVGLGYIF
ncbi:MAG: hypothetical protein EOP54_04070 [Sphingobacteriales bacterium]|nr:MAG: hypothetical protein EOP54_04070 [Sphingobacteriales bacterium]